MKASDTGGTTFEQVAPGTYPARCYKLIDLGTQLSEYQGESKRRHQIIIGWELPTELMTSGEYEGQPFTASKFYTLSLSEKSTLRPHLVNWRGRDFTPEELAGFELKKLLNKTCLLSIVHDDKGRAKVGGVMALPKGMQVPDPVNEPVYFSLDPDEFSQEVFDSFSDKMKALIVGADEYKARGKARAPVTTDDNDGPDF